MDCIPPPLLPAPPPPPYRCSGAGDRPRPRPCRPTRWDRFSPRFRTSSPPRAQSGSRNQTHRSPAVVSVLKQRKIKIENKQGL